MGSSVLQHEGPFPGRAEEIPTTGQRGSIPNTPIEFLLEALYAGAIGGSVVALFFLAVDLVNGQPLFSVSLMGSVIFQGAAVQDVTEVQLRAVVYYSILHIVAFTALGGMISLLVHEIELHSRHPVVLLVVLFAMLEAAFFLVAPLVMPGDLIASLGIVRIGIANLLAAASLALFFMLTHRAGAWHELMHTTPELLLDSLYSGALGGTAVGLFFLVVDLVDGQPFFTPSLLGSVIFDGVAAQDVTTVQPRLVIYFSILHMLVFTALGGAISLLVHEVELHAKHPIVVLIVFFGILEVALLTVAPLALPGVIEKLGIVRVGIANLLAAGTMVFFFVFEHRAKPWPKLKHTPADLAFDSFFSGAIGGSAVALYFLVFDLIDGQVLFTPSLMGSVLFEGASPADVVKVQLDTVTYFGAVHFLSFAVIGAIISVIVHEVELHAKHPFVVLVVLFAILEAIFLVTVPLALPGIIERVGIFRIAGANLLAAGSMALFFVWSQGLSQSEELGSDGSVSFQSRNSKAAKSAK